MPEAYLADKDALCAMLDTWILRGAVIAPVRTPAGDVVFESIDDAAACEFDFVLQANSVKEWLLPQSETLFSYRLKERASFAEALEAAPALLFGVRPCDMSAVNAICRAMSESPADRHCMARARNLATVVMACPTVFAGHFCHLMGAGPWLHEGFDWQITPLGSQYFIEVATLHGRQLLDGVKDLVSKARPRIVADLAHARAQEAILLRQDLDVASVRAKLARGALSRDFWDKSALQCQSCGGCSFVCPTCSCFSIADVPNGPDSGQRRRQWDSCAFSGFTRMAGGHNPSALKSQRLQRRLVHKLDRFQQQPDGSPCVGCARCAAVCFSGLDMLQMLRLIAAEGEAS